MVDAAASPRLAAYAIATALNLAITVLPIFQRSFLLSIRALEADTEASREALLKRPRFGRSIGFLERQIYLYALSAKGLDLITAVVVFKAFAEWIKPNVQPGKTAATDDSQKMLLARFYAYTIGNLLSILWAIAIHEASGPLATLLPVLSLGTALALAAILGLAMTVAATAHGAKPATKAAPPASAPPGTDGTA